MFNPSPSFNPFNPNKDQHFTPPNSPDKSSPKSSPKKEKHELYDSHEPGPSTPVKHKHLEPPPPLSPYGKINRKVVSYANIPINTPLKKIVEVSTDVAKAVLQLHARGRVIMFGVAAIALHGLAVRTNPEQLRNVRLNINSAWEQMGQASKGKHAAHMNAGAGYIDNINKLILEEIVNEKGVTPKKAKLMQAKGFSSEDFDLMAKNHFDLETVTDVFNIRWPSDPNKPNSVLNKTRISTTLNLTTPIDSHANLTCDKGLEKDIRKVIISLYHELIQDYVSIEDALQMYCKSVVAHFTLVINQLNIYLPILREYEIAFNRLYEINAEGKKTVKNLPPEELESSLKHLQSKFEDVLKYQIEDDKIQQIDQNHQAKKQFHIKILDQNKKFMKEVNGFLNHTKPLTGVTNYLKLCGDDLNKEIASRIDHVEKYLDEAKWERKGTVVPDMDQIYKQLLEDYHLTEAENQSTKDLQLKMLEHEVHQGPDGDLTEYIAHKRKQEALKASKPKRLQITSIAKASLPHYPLSNL